jgi:hypothetical protein
MNYEERDLEHYNEYMQFIYSIILDTDLPNKVKKVMLDGTRIERQDNTTWFITHKQNILKFMSFYQWLNLKQIQEQREIKLNQLLNGKT